MVTIETPTGTGEYYSLFKEAMLQKLKDTITRIELTKTSIAEAKDLVDTNIDKYKTEYSIDLTTYKEYNDNKYINGDFYSQFKQRLTKCKDTATSADMYNIFTLANQQRSLHLLSKERDKYDKAASLGFIQYKNILKLYYTEVQKHIILNGEAYTIAPYIGSLCVNRVRVSDKARKKLNFVATRKRKEELLAQGKHLYNEEEAKYYEKIGIPYTAEDYRVYLDTEYLYEYVIIYSKYKDSSMHVFKPADYRGHTLRGKTNDQLIEECNGDVNKICELDLDIRTKLNMCIKSNIGLYTNFIRNEDQKSIRTISSYRKNRQ